MTSEIAHLLPEPIVGAVTSVTPISMGQSGAGVYAVTGTRGEFILRVHAHPETWEPLVRVLRRAADARIAPALLHVDEAAHAMLSARVAGIPLAAGLADPTQRGAVIAGIVAQLRALHALDASDLPVSDPVGFARMKLVEQRARPGYPAWAADLEPIFAATAERLARDPQRVVSHNDLNPGNVLWDGSRAWIVDWEVAGLNHPFYDLAALAMFMQLDEPTAAGLLALQLQRQPDAAEVEMLATLRRLVALLCGVMFTSLVSDLAFLPAEAPTLSEVYAGIRSGALQLRDPGGRGAFALALLRVGLS